ncbi:NAF1-domain-containing protein [Whalleya microplaca]|nr:NAF1-domain-containing protein [Whalleya microplaca]
MSGHVQIPGLTTLSQPSNGQDEAQATISQESSGLKASAPDGDTTILPHDSSSSRPVETELNEGTESMELDKSQSTQSQENVDVVVTDAPPSPPSLTSGLEALLGGLDPLPQQTHNATEQPTSTDPNGQVQVRNEEGQVGDQGGPEWEEDSSPYESSSDSSTSDDSEDESEDEGNYKVLGPEETARILMEMEGGSDDEGEGKAKGAGSGAQIRTKNEVPEEVIPKPDVKITPEMEITELGVVEHIVENTVVIKANTTGEYQVIDTGSVLCTESRAVIAAIADLIGSVKQPRYTAKFTNEEEIKSFGLELGTKVFYPPSHASYVFTQALRGERGTDASNWHDEEVADDEIEFSDDEKEAEYKRQLKAKKKGGRGGRGGGGGRGGQHEASPLPPVPGLKYDDDDDDGPYRKLARPTNFGQGQPPPMDSRYTIGSSNANGAYRGGRGSRGRGRGHRGDSRGGHSLPPRPPRGQNYQPPQSQPSFNYSPVPPPPTNASYPPPPAQFNGAPNPQFPFPWPQNAPQGFIPPPPPQFTAQAGAGAYFNPAFFNGMPNPMQGQPSQQDGQWPGGPG